MHTAAICCLRSALIAQRTPHTLPTPRHSASLRATPRHSAPLRVTPRHSASLRMLRMLRILRVTPRHSAALRGICYPMLNVNGQTD